MSEVWLSVIVVGAATIAFKATGPVLLGRGRELPGWLAGPVSYLALAGSLLWSLPHRRRPQLDRLRRATRRLAAGAAAVALRAPLLVVVVVAAATAALVRLV